MLNDDCTKNKKSTFDTSLVSRLIKSQFPQWKDLPIYPVASSGWDNKTFHLGSHMLIRMPTTEYYQLQVEKEQLWLPKLAPFLPLQIPIPLAMGQPNEEYPWKWSIYKWLEGESVVPAKIADLCEFAKSLAHFLFALQKIDSTHGPLAGPHSFYRGGSLKHYDSDVKQAIKVLWNKIDAKKAIKLWETASGTIWQSVPVWVHGDISAGNLLVKNGRLCAVIDFGQLAVGDPACDLAIAWTLFKDNSRENFRTTLQLDANTWERGRAWALWKALIVAAGFANPNNLESNNCWNIIHEILQDRIN